MKIYDFEAKTWTTTEISDFEPVFGSFFDESGLLGSGANGILSVVDEVYATTNAIYNFDETTGITIQKPYPLRLYGAKSHLVDGTSYIFGGNSGVPSQRNFSAYKGNGIDGWTFVTTRPWAINAEIASIAYNDDIIFLDRDGNWL